MSVLFDLEDILTLLGLIAGVFVAFLRAWYLQWLSKRLNDRAHLSCLLLSELILSVYLADRLVVLVSLVLQLFGGIELVCRGPQGKTWDHHDLFLGCLVLLQLRLRQ